MIENGSLPGAASRSRLANRCTTELPAADGSGPPAGTRVFGYMPGGCWAELAAVPTSCLAPVPDALTNVQAAVLPDSGLKAVCGLAQAKTMKERKVVSKIAVEVNR